VVGKEDGHGVETTMGLYGGENRSGVGRGSLEAIVLLRQAKHQQTQHSHTTCIPGTFQVFPERSMKHLVSDLSPERSTFFERQAIFPLYSPTMLSLFPVTTPALYFFHSTQCHPSSSRFYRPSHNESAPYQTPVAPRRDQYSQIQVTSHSHSFYLSHCAQELSNCSLGHCGVGRPLSSFHTYTINLEMHTDICQDG
jgi:hypothetical protein